VFHLTATCMTPILTGWLPGGAGGSMIVHGGSNHGDCINSGQSCSCDSGWAGNTCAQSVGQSVNIAGVAYVHASEQHPTIILVCFVW
jgi:hypothetical protein